ncbi:MAG: hypothetical protein B7X46_13275 [Thiomonas sp. 15-66-11]|jgi:hypothetical protein|uniref:hypothetical protein n=1 Tax=Thiomonas sp. TaxID=2047785 RepID=UPI000BC3F857|nr:hypothetical protein [Thiomonas sp.]OZB42982.1 MAG: hypothetical protein B7X46_13275 [Thiomonas sp. 15-66-11]
MPFTRPITLPMTTQHITGVLTLPTLLRIMAVMGVGIGMVSAAIAIGLYWGQLGPGRALGLFIGGALFNALALMSATLIGYWPYRVLARKGWWGLHRLVLHAVTRA